MIDKVLTVIERHDSLAEAMSQPDAMNDMKTFTQMAREHRGLDEAVEVCKLYKSKYEQLINLIKRLGLESDIKIIDPVPHLELGYYLKSFEFLIRV